MFNKTKVTILMKSGNSFSLKFKEFEISKLSINEPNNRELTYKLSYLFNRYGFTVDIAEIEAVIMKKVIF